jgi:alpha-glucosidase
MLSLYRDVLRLRRAAPALGDGVLHWLDSSAHVLAFRREPDFICVVNLGGAAMVLPAHRQVLLASTPLDDGMLPGDAAVWLSE